MLRQYKALGYYAYFYLLRKKRRNGVERENDVERAIGEIFLWYFSVQGSIVSSAIIYDRRSIVWDKPYYTIYNFIIEDFENKIKVFHDTLSGTVVENVDFSDIIKKYSVGDTLFYSDSPYIGTSDYDDEAGGVSEFSSANMKELIRGLIQASKTGKQEDTKEGSKPNKFIFSMRAVKSGEEIDASGNSKYDKMVSGNKDICQYVYKEFLSFKKQLYVLVIYEKKKDLGELIQKSKLIEIMITNYKIVSFEVGKYICEAFTFNDYLKCIKANMVGYQKSWGL